MPRRSSRKSEKEIIETVISEATSTTPKKGRKSLEVEAKEAVTKVSPTKSAKKKIKKEVDIDEEEDDTQETPVVPKINRVKSKTVVKEETEQKPKKTPAKRKAKTEEDEDDADDTKVKKKRKTKEEKEAEAMPLATRTVVSTLKQAMHIGAHVSAAGGMCLKHLKGRLLTQLLLQEYKTL